MSDEHKISFLETKNDSSLEKQAVTDKKMSLDEIAETQKAKKLSNKHNNLMTSHYISSARTGEISDQGGPTKYTKSESSNTIFDSNKSARLAQEIDSKTRVKNEKEEIASNRREAEDKRMNDLAEALRGTELSKDSTISPAGIQSGSNYYSPKNSISIFDTKEFERLAEKTSGEKVSEEVVQKNSQKDESWKTDGKMFSSKDVINKLFDNLTFKRDE